MRKSMIPRIMSLSKEKYGFIGGVSGKEPACQSKRCKRCGFDPRLGRYPGERKGNPLQYSCLENPMDTGTWRATVHEVTKSRTWLKRLSMHAKKSRWDLVNKSNWIWGSCFLAKEFGDKVTSKIWVYLERNRLHRQRVVHLRK